MPSSRRSLLVLVIAVAVGGSFATPAAAQHVTFLPYIQPGDNGPYAPRDQMLVAWQTDETAPVTGAYRVWYGRTPDRFEPATVAARVVDNYLAADQQFASLNLPFRYGAHSNYTAILKDLAFDTRYVYRVTGPGLPADGFSASFHTRKTGERFVFQVMGDEGFYPGIPNTDPPLVSDYEARVINTMWRAPSLALPGHPSLPPADLALNTGDNVYVAGADSNYRDVWMRDWNNNVASNETGAPFIRSVPLYIVAGNHDVGSTGATVNLLADTGPTMPGFSGPGPFGGGIGGGDALGYFNNYYFPQNGPDGVDIQYHFTGDLSAATNFLFTYGTDSYTSSRAIDALRASTEVDGGRGVKRQIDRMGNYSFDYGNAHFLFLDANPHLFDNLLPNGPPTTPPDFPFPHYPTPLATWVINDLDASRQPWKVVVFHQPIFSSGNATLSNDQMRTTAQILQDHGVNLVFNGHEHNYQRTLPLRALSNVTRTPQPGVPQVEVDNRFDGLNRTVPDGVLYFVEGAGGNRDFDDNLGNPRGNGASIDQDDAALGTTTRVINGTSYQFANGPGSFLDTSLSNDAMKAFLSGAGSGPKITAKFKSKVFSFAHVLVDDNRLTLYQISEPLTGSSSATSSNPAPFGRDFFGAPINDPLPDTIFDPASRTVISKPATGPSALLDKLTVTKPDLSRDVRVGLKLAHSTSGSVRTLDVKIENGSAYGLNGAQIVLTLPEGVSFDAVNAGTATVQGQDVVVSLGRIPPAGTRILQITVIVPASGDEGSDLDLDAELRSSTALPVRARNK